MGKDTAIHVPSLSENGWVNDPLLKADYLLGHFFASDYSQSTVYAGNVSSMAWVIFKTQGKVKDTVRLLSDTLSTYLGRYFESPVVNVSEYTGPGYNLGGSNVALSIYVGIYVNGKEVSVTKALELTNSNSFKIISINNG